MRWYLVLALCLTVACRPDQAPDDARHAEGRDPGNPRPGSTEQNAEGTIRTQETRWRQALAAGDTGAIKTFFTDDAIYAPDGTPHIRGLDSVSARWAREFGIPDFKLERSPIRIEVASSADMAQEVGTYVVRFTENKRQREAAGTYMTAWRKEGGDWKIASYMWNRSRSEPPGR